MKLMWIGLIGMIVFAITNFILIGNKYWIFSFSLWSIFLFIWIIGFFKVIRSRK